MYTKLINGSIFLLPISLEVIEENIMKIKYNSNFFVDKITNRTLNKLAKLTHYL